MTGSASVTKKTIREGQNTRTTWLGRDATIPQIARCLIALANSHGGLFILGIDPEEDEITGIEDTDEGIDRILQAALEISPPLIIPMPEANNLAGKLVIRVNVPGGMPHVYSFAGHYLKRRDRENIPLDPRTLRRLMIQRGQISFESEIAYGATMDHLDWEKVAEYTKQLRGIDKTDREMVLLKRGCLTREGEKMYPTNAGILLFGKDPQQHLRGCDITAVRFAGEIMSDTFSRQDIGGTLPDQIQRAETFLVDHLRRDVKLRDTMEREEEFEYPMEAARELVVNAVAHRDYSISGDGIRLFIFRNHLEVTSPGSLPGPVTIENIKDERFSRNPVIVQVLSDMGYIERLGYGVDRVIELMEKQKMRAPEFQEQDGGFRVRLYNIPAEEPAKEPKAEAPKPEKPIAFHGMYQDTPINPRQEAALLFLHEEGNDRITNSDMKKLFPDVHPETLRRNLADLVNKDILEKQGQKRGSYYILKRN